MSCCVRDAHFLSFFSLSLNSLAAATLFPTREESVSMHTSSLCGVWEFDGRGPDNCQMQSNAVIPPLSCLFDFVRVCVSLSCHLHRWIDMFSIYMCIFESAERVLTAPENSVFKIACYGTLTLSLSHTYSVRLLAAVQRAVIHSGIFGSGIALMHVARPLHMWKWNERNDIYAFFVAKWKSWIPQRVAESDEGRSATAREREKNK